MTAWVEFLILFAVIATFAYREASIRSWTIGVPIALTVFTLFSSISWLVILPAWIAYAVVATIFNVDDMRYEYLTTPVFNYFKKVLPQMSDTEKVALEAGDVWWDGELFSGSPDWQKMSDFPPARLTQEEQSFLDNEVETLCSMINNWDIVNQGDLSPEIWAYIKKEGFWGLVIPKQYGGKGFSALAHSTIISKIASTGCSVAVTVMVPNSLGPGELLVHYGTDDQKNYFLPRLAQGKEIPCFALTGPESGSDAGAMKDKGTVCYGLHDGERVLGIKLSWDKRYITLAPIATLLGVAIKLYDPDHLIGNTRDVGITLCLIPTTHPGVQVGERHNPLGQAFMNGPTRGEDVFIPLDWVIGGRDLVGQGWRMLMECLSIGRSISLPAMSTATGKMCYLTSGAYARVRKQFKVAIAKFEGIEEALARIAGNTYLLEATRRVTAQAVSEGINPSVVSAIAKYHMTEMGRQVIDDAMDIHAGRGVQMGPRNYLALHYIAIPISITVEGANILTRNLIVFGQGAVRCHPYILKEMFTTTNPDPQQAMKDFDKLLVSHIGFTVKNIFRSLIYGVTGAHIISVPATRLSARYMKQLTRMSSALAVSADITMLLLGGDLKRKERLSARLGDVLSHLYLGAATLKHFKDSGYPVAHEPYVHWALQTCLANIQEAFDDFYQNFPNRLIGFVVKCFLFPLGRAYSKPTDQIDHALAQDMTQLSHARENLAQYSYVSSDKDDAVGRIENAFRKTIKADEVWEKIKTATGQGIINGQMDSEEKLIAALNAHVITDIDMQAVREAQAAYLDAIAVDEFQPAYFTRSYAKPSQQTA